MSQVEYGLKYCEGKCDIDGGWNFNGASNLKELKKRVHGKFMLRLRKADVLKELPPKTEEMVILADKLPATVAKLDAKLLREHSPNAKEFREKMAALSVHKNQPLATYRRMLGVAKLPYAVSFIREHLDNSDEKLLVFAYHTAVITQLAMDLMKYRPAVITGMVPTAARQNIVDQFQNDPNRRLVIGNYLACGTGFTLTKATRVIFVEYSWVPADNDQASDRAHRIGQRDHVYVQYLVFKNSLDRAILETHLRKKENIRKI
jgi:SWI/SNF-related matrix-associated actin-dependent regulator 1 of chromatin subfamily A